MKIVQLLLALVLVIFSCNPSRSQDGLGKIKTLVGICAKTRSSDHFCGLSPGATGIANATAETTTQLDHDGKPLANLTIFGTDGKPDPRFPRMPNAPFRIDAAPINMPLDKILLNPIHAYYHSREQINGGKNNMFAAMSNVGGWTMGYFDGSHLRMWQWAKEYTLADNFFMGTFGGSYLNHLWLICACTPKHDTAPDAARARLDPDGQLTKRPDSPPANDGAVQVFSASGGQVAPDGYSVNTTQPPYQPSRVPPAVEGPPDLADPKGNQSEVPLPPQTLKTIVDT